MQLLDWRSRAVGSQDRPEVAPYWSGVGAGSRSGLGVPFPFEAAVDSLLEEPILFVATYTNWFLPRSWMSAEIKALRAELAALRLRCEAQEGRIEDQEERIQRLEERGEAQRTEAAGDRSFDFSELLERSSLAGSQSLGSYSRVSSGTLVAVEKEDIAGRLELARQCGLFLKRALGGEFRGGSGRDRLKVGSTIYIVLADFHGRKCEPAKVFSNFSDCKSLCKSGGSCGKSVFLGFATTWEAQEALRAAEIPWPLEG